MTQNYVNVGNIIGLWAYGGLDDAPASSNEAHATTSNTHTNAVRCSCFVW